MRTFLGELNRLAYVLAPVFYKLVWMSLTAVLLGGVLLAVRRVWDKKIPPVWKSILWGLVLLCLLVPYRVSSPFSLAGKLTPVAEISYREEYDRVHRQAHSALEQAAEPEMAQAEDLAEKEEKLYLKSAFFDVALPLCWGIGAAAALVWLAASHLSFARQLKKGEPDPNPELTRECCRALGIRRKLSVQIQPELGSPALAGIFRPRILLPRYAGRMQPDTLRYVLLHEMGHYKRKDLWVNELLLVLRCVYWFNPLLWVLLRAMREDMEVLNDSYVLRQIGPEEEKPYAKSLVEVLGRAQELPLAPRLVTMTDGAKNVERRISMIKTKTFFQKHKMALGAGCLVLAGMLAVLFLTGGTLTEEQAAEKLVESIQYEKGVISFTVPKGYEHPEDWNILVSGRSVFTDGMSMSVHLLQEEAQQGWEPGKTYQIDTVGMGYEELMLDVYLPPDTERSEDLLSYVKYDPSQPLERTVTEGMKTQMTEFQQAGQKLEKNFVLARSQEQEEGGLRYELIMNEGFRVKGEDLAPGGPVQMGDNYIGYCELRALKGETLAGQCFFPELLYFQQVPFELSVRDYNQDGMPDVTLAQWLGSSLQSVNIFTCDENGSFRSLTPEGGAAITWQDNRFSSPIEQQPDGSLVLPVWNNATDEMEYDSLSWNEKTGRYE